MFKTLARKLKWSLAVAIATTGLLSAAPASAVVYQGSWDPAFGAAFPDLGWRGEASFFVPDACLNQSGWIFNFESCSSFDMKILSAEVEFYKLSDPNNAAFQETLAFDVASDAVVAMELTNGSLSGILGTFLYSVPSTLALAGGPYTDFVLFFEGDLARMAYFSDPPRGKPSFGFSDRNPPDGAPFINFRVVPEPGTLALLMGGIGLIGFASRQRKRAAEAHLPE